MAWFNDFEGTEFKIQNQYVNTNIQEFLNAIAKVRGVYKRQAVETFRRDVRNLKTAIGASLDQWGKILKFSRFLPVENLSDKNYRTFNFNKSYFSELQFGRIDEDDFLMLGDQEYRFILLLILQGQNTRMNIKSLAEMARELFGMIGLNCSVFDNTSMQKLHYVVDAIPPLWFSYVLKYYDILPRPAGIGADLVIDNSLPIGFFREPPNLPESNRQVTNFFFAKFYFEGETKK